MMPGGVDLIAVFRDLCKPLFSHGSFMRLLVLAGDGIGPEITAATLLVLQTATRRFRSVQDRFGDRPRGHGIG